MASGMWNVIGAATTKALMHSHSLASHVRLVTLNRVLRNMKKIFMIEDDDEFAFIKEEARHQLNDRYFK